MKRPPCTPYEKIKQCARCGTTGATSWRKSYCRPCYEAARIAKIQADPNAALCERDGCNEKARRRGRCDTHYREILRREKGIQPRPVVRKAKLQCSTEECDELVHAKGLCIRHYQNDLRRRKLESRKLQGYGNSGSRGTEKWLPKEPKGDPRGHWDERPNVTVVHWIPRKATLPWTCPHCREVFEESIAA